MSFYPGLNPRLICKTQKVKRNPCRDGLLRRKQKRGADRPAKVAQLGNQHLRRVVGDEDVLVHLAPISAREALAEAHA